MLIKADGSSMKTVVILHLFMPAYRREFFEMLISKGVQDQINYQVLAGPPPAKIGLRNDSIGSESFYKKIKARELKFGERSLIWHRMPKETLKSNLIIMEHGVRTLMIYRWILSGRSQKLAFWGHGKTYTKSNFSFEERIKEWLARKAVAFFVYTEGGRNHLVDCGVDPCKITALWNSTDTKQILKYAQEVEEIEIHAFKKRLGITDGSLAIFIGGLDRYKDIPFLLSSFAQIRKTVPDFQLVVFGDGPHRKMIEESNLPGLIYGERADMRAMGILSHIADVVLMPGLVGLIAVDSFAMQVPVITRNRSHHAPEFEYLINDFNSIISNDSLESYSSAVVQILNNPQKLAKLKSGCRESLSNFSTEQMVERFHGGVLDVLSRKS